ncbi:MAG: hypothetical protein HQM11_20175 [SAR324 cluster bacterium]|nr:hypothetical protein [SAR324 cluster bacterium]
MKHKVVFFRKNFWLCLWILLTLLVVISCGDDDQTGGGVIFELTWDTQAESIPEGNTRTLPAEVSQLQVSVLNNAGEVAKNSAGVHLQLSLGKDATVGVLEAIIPGVYTVRFLGLGSDGTTPLYRAIRNNVTVQDNQTTNLGVIQMTKTTQTTTTTTPPSGTGTQPTTTTSPPSGTGTQPRPPGVVQ